MPTAATTTASSDQNRLKLPTRLHDEAQLIVSFNYAVIFEAGAIHPSWGESPACSCRTKWCNDRQVAPVHCNPSLESVVSDAFYLNAGTTAFIAIEPQMSRIAARTRRPGVPTATILKSG